MKSIVRVAVNNNFNCNKKEWKQLDQMSKLNPDKSFFINTSIKTPKLLTINDHPYKAVITLNPDIHLENRLVNRLYDIVSDKIAFVRIKYIPEGSDIVDLINTVSESHTVVITLQRFNGIESITQYVPNFRDHYKWSHNRFRLVGDSLKEAEKLIGSNTYICDQKGLGCKGCGLCSTLTNSNNLPIHTLNLSSSGICPYNCVDCYAKSMQHFLKKIGQNIIRYDHIHMNHKQSGKTKHIQDAA